MRAIGTVGQSRAAGAITLMSSTAKVYVAKWLDNSLIASNRHVHNQLHKLLDRSPKKRRKSGRPHLLIQHWSFGLRPLPLIFWISCHQHLGKWISISSHSGSMLNPLQSQA
ncbi:Myosin-binding protein C,cardiac-type [Trichinella pseudospiralis]